MKKYEMQPIPVRGVDTDKAHPGEEPQVRSRLVAKEIRRDEARAFCGNAASRGCQDLVCEVRF